MRVRVATCLLLLLGCNQAVDGPPAVAGAPDIVQPQAAIFLGGRIRAHDGAPLRRAEYSVQRMGFIEPVARGQLDADGGFHVELAPDVYMLGVSAVDHAQVVEQLFVGASISVEGTLGTYWRDEPGETLTLKTQWVGADGQAREPATNTAARQADGSYRLDLADRPADAAALRYQLVGGGGRTYNGPLADSFDDDGGGDYWSVVALAGRDALVLDLSALPPAGVRSRMTWRGEPPELSALRSYRDGWRPRVETVLSAMPRKDGRLLAPGEQDRAAAAALSAEALAAADAAADEDLRVLLRLAHLDLFLALEDETNIRVRAEWMLDHVDPTDPRLGLYGNLLNVLSRTLRDAPEAAYVARVESWLARMRNNPCNKMAIDAIWFLLRRADERHDRVGEAAVAELYAAAMQPRFAGMYAVKHLGPVFDPQRTLQRGKPFPEFAFPALDPAGAPVSRADRAGRPYLVEFWATWCGPCVAEMPELHAAYAQLHGLAADADHHHLAPVAAPRVEFVFVSLDGAPKDVAAFREQHWAMPWTHAFVGREREAETMARYGFTGVPTAVLVGGDGVIRAVGAELRNGGLLPALERVLAE